MDSDDDFLDSSLKASSSKLSLSRRKRTKKTLKKSPIKKHKPAPPTITINESLSLSHCVNCQMPFNLLHRWESPEVHASSCLETDFGNLSPCPHGLDCDSTIRSHFAKFSHLELATLRDHQQSPAQKSPQQVPVFKFKPVAAKVTSSEETEGSKNKASPIIRISSDENEENDGNQEEITTISEDIFETPTEILPKSPEVNHFSDDDDAFFEELTNRALEIDAVKDSQGDIEIKVQVDPKVELQSLVMKIPSQERKINVIGKLNAKKQSTLDSFFGLKPKTVEEPEMSTNSKATSGGGSKINNQFSRQNLRDQNENKQQRTCPFYKKIPETHFAVDAFNYGNIAGISHYFLSHFHYDHYGGMTRKWHQPVICSPITAKLILLKIKVDAKYLKILHLNQPEIIENIQVTLLDANHCPGSVMFLFKFPNNGKVILHTGDFRACPEMEEFPELWNYKVDKVYLDTTYCRPEYDFPAQSLVISSAIEHVCQHLKQFPRTLICVGSYTIGKERIFTAIAEEIDAKIWASTEKIRVLKTLSNAIIDSRLTTESNKAQIHVVEMFKVKKREALMEHWIKFGKDFEHCLGIVPTGWTHEKNSDNSLETMSVKNLKCKLFQLNVPYSEHSSFSELRRFITFLKLDSADKILATVNVGNPASRNAQKAVFRKWIQDANQSKLKF